MTGWIRSIGLFALLLVSGCAAQVGDAPPSALQSTPAATLVSTTATATALPSLEFDSIVLLAGEAPGDWEVIGLLRNPAGVGVSNVRIRVTVADSRGNQLAELTTGTLMSNLAPGEAGPFTAEFPGVGLAVTAEARVDSFERHFIRRSKLEIEVLEEFLTETGDLALLGTVTNPSSQVQSFVSLGLIGFGAASQPRSVAVLQHGPRVLGAEESVPFLALASGNPGRLNWQAYHDAVEVGARVPDSLILDEAPRVRIDSQGNIFVVGSLRNAAGAPSQASVLIMLWEGDRILSLTELRAPVPLQVGERLAFAAQDFPGLSRRLAGSDPASLRIESRIEGADPAEQPMVLQAEVEAFHSVGSSLFLRGILRNETLHTVDPAAVLAELRSTDGELLSSGWFTAPGPLASGEQTEFVIRLPLPTGTDLGEVEFDLRALGSPLKAEQ